jgi:hypothetical protein
MKARIKAEGFPLMTLALMAVQPQRAAAASASSPA